MELWIGAFNLGFLYALMAVGVYICYRILDFPDITVDGSFTTGAAVSAVLIASGWNPFFALGIALLVSGMAGVITGLIHTKMKVNGLLAGILVMIGLYSINLHIMGKSNIPLLSLPSFLDFFQRVNPGLPSEIWLAIALACGMAIFWQLIAWFFRTDLGMTIRATGNNPTMSSANGVNVDFIKILGIGLSNSLVGLAGGLVAQYQGFADIGMGIGTVVNGLAAVIIGEAIFKRGSVAVKIFSAIAGSVVFRFMIAFALYAGMNPLDLKLMTALFVLLTLYISYRINKEKRRATFAVNWLQRFKNRVFIKYALTLVIIGLVGAGSYAWLHRSGTFRSSGKSHCRMAIIQFVSNPVLDITREALLDELDRIGYKNGENCEIFLENGNGEMGMVNSILDKYVMNKMDVVITISTPVTQAALKKITNTPLVFVTVANPFIINAGRTETDHLPNVTGTYGWAPMDRVVNFVKELFPGKKTIRVGTIWDPSSANSEFNVQNFKKAIATVGGIELTEKYVTATAEVQTAAMSLVVDHPDCFVFAPDNIVYSAFEAIYKESSKAGIPIVICDVERLGSGALLAVGYDYSGSGQMGAHLVDRVLKGADTQSIPFQRYKKLTIGINLEESKRLNIPIPENLIYQANQFYGTKPAKETKIPRIGIVQFAQEPNVEIAKAGLIHGLNGHGYRDGENVKLIYKDANADFSMINSIMQDFVRQDVDIIVPLSTPCLQAAVQMGSGRERPKIVFTYIYDPYRIGAAETPEKHLPNLTGVSCFPPVTEILDLIKEMFPERKKIGIVWNSSEANSEATVIKIREYADRLGLSVVEATVTAPAEVLDAARSLVSKGAQVFLNPGDNTLNVSYDSYVKVAGTNKIPLFSVDGELIYNGTVAVLGPDYYRTGFDGGKILARVLDGETVAQIPIQATEETVFYLNMDVAEQQGFPISPDLLKKAQKVVDSKTQQGDTTTMELKKEYPPKRLTVFRFNDHSMILEVMQGVREYFEQSRILDKFNITLDEKSAQGDYPMAQTIAQDIVSQKYDYVITLSTPALQVMASANKSIPHIFGAVTDPYRMGVAKNPREHQANITGVATFQPVASTFKLMREIFPRLRKVGIVWNPSEACSEACTEIARSSAEMYGFQLIEANVTATSEVMDAVRSLLTKGVDIFLTSGDNTVILALPTIAKVLQDKKIPYFTNTFSDVEKGAFASLGADYMQVGLETAKMALRVIEGETPASIPIYNFVPEKLYLNLALAKKYNVDIPDSTLNRAQSVLR